MTVTEMEQAIIHEETVYYTLQIWEYDKRLAQTYWECYESLNEAHTSALKMIHDNLDIRAVTIRKEIVWSRTPHQEISKSGSVIEITRR